MAQPLELEDSGGPGRARRAGKPAAVGVLPEEQRLEAFEQGYKAGWDDAITQTADERTHISADLAGNLKDLSFTFQEARTHVLKAIEPLLRDMVSKVLPGAAAAGLPDLIATRVAEVAQSASEAPVRISLSPDDRERVTGVLPEVGGMPVELCDDPLLAPGQVAIRMGETEESIDLDGVIADVARLIDDFYTLNERREANG